jgi:hypothetical protein
LVYKYRIRVSTLSSNKVIIGPSPRGVRNLVTVLYSYHRVPQDDQSNPLVPPLLLTEAAVLPRLLAAAGPTLSVPLLPIVQTNDVSTLCS